MAEIAPIFVEVKEAARILSLTTWSIYDLLNKGAITGKYHGRKRLVSYASLEAYAQSLPETPPETLAEASV